MNMSLILHSYTTNATTITYFLFPNYNSAVSHYYSNNHVNQTHELVTSKKFKLYFDNLNAIQQFSNLPGGTSKLVCSLHNTWNLILIYLTMCMFTITNLLISVKKFLVLHEFVKMCTKLVTHFLKYHTQVKSSVPLKVFYSKFLHLQCFIAKIYNKKIHKKLFLWLILVTFNDTGKGGRALWDPLKW